MHQQATRIYVEMAPVRLVVFLDMEIQTLINTIDGESMFPNVSDWKVVQDDSRPTSFPQLSWLLLAVLWTSFNNVSLVVDF